MNLHIYIHYYLTTVCFVRFILDFDNSALFRHEILSMLAKNPPFTKAADSLLCNEALVDQLWKLMNSGRMHTLNFSPHTFLWCLYGLNPSIYQSWLGQKPKQSPCLERAFCEYVLTFSEPQSIYIIPILMLYNSPGGLF